jgi:SAM-dependent methyltransferase
LVDLEQYRAGEKEQARTADLLRVIPKGRRTVLDIGARDGHFSRLLTEHFAEVTALDLRRPDYDFPRVKTVAGDVTNLKFPDNSFDCVFCAEVLEHVPSIGKACAEIVRVARHEVIIGVPYRQDIRVGRTTCRSCGAINPPWGHVNTFDDRRLRDAFPNMRVLSKSFVGVDRSATNFIAALLMNWAGNPWGCYGQDEPCIYCGATLVPPENRNLASKVFSALAYRINLVQSRLTRPHANWIHLVLSKD